MEAEEIPHPSGGGWIKVTATREEWQELATLLWNWLPDLDADNPGRHFLELMEEQGIEA